MTKAFEFVRQVRSELGKIVWPSRKETSMSAVAVFMMVTVCALFLFLADQILSFVVSLVLNLGV